MDKKMKKLALSRETIRPLTREGLRRVAAGDWRTSRPNTETLTTVVICTIAGVVWSCAGPSVFGDCPISPPHTAVCTTH